MEIELTAFLQEVFKCPADIAARIGSRARVRRYAERSIIINQGDDIRLAFLLVAGRVHALSVAIGGQQILLYEFLPGDFFGAVAQTEAVAIDAEIVAAEDTRTAVFQLKDFLSLIETYGCVGLAVSGMLLKQLRAVAARMVEHVSLSAAGRIHAELLRLARLADGRTIRPVPVLSTLAVRVHSTRETVSRTLHALERRGIVRREGDALFIVAPARLQDMIV